MLIQSPIEIAIPPPPEPLGRTLASEATVPQIAKLSRTAGRGQMEGSGSSHGHDFLRDRGKSNREE